MDLSHLKEPNYWFKCASIILWSLYLSIYIWLFSYLMNSPDHMNKFVGVAVSVLGGGVGFTYITNIYNTPVTQFNMKNFYAALSILVFFGFIVWSLWVYQFGNGNNEPVLTTYFAGLIVIYIISLFVAPTYILSSGKGDKTT
jgi:hypothetical protein